MSGLAAQQLDAARHSNRKKITQCKIDLFMEITGQLNVPNARGMRMGRTKKPALS
jgi:hypothetical protein